MSFPSLPNFHGSFNSWSCHSLHLLSQSACACVCEALQTVATGSFNFSPCFLPRCRGTADRALSLVLSLSIAAGYHRGSLDLSSGQDWLVVRRLRCRVATLGRVMHDLPVAMHQPNKTTLHGTVPCQRVFALPAWKGQTRDKLATRTSLLLHQPATTPFFVATSINSGRAAGGVLPIPHPGPTCFDSPDPAGPGP